MSICPERLSYCRVGPRSCFSSYVCVHGVFLYSFMFSLCPMRVVCSYGLETTIGSCTESLDTHLSFLTFCRFHCLFAQPLNFVSFDKAGFPQDLCVRLCVSRLEMAMDTCRGGYNLGTILSLCHVFVTILVCSALLSHPAFHNLFRISLVFASFLRYWFARRC